MTCEYRVYSQRMMERTWTVELQWHAHFNSLTQPAPHEERNTSEIFRTDFTRHSQFRTSNHQASKDVYSHLISALKVEASLETTKHGKSKSSNPNVQRDKEPAWTTQAHHRSSTSSNQMHHYQNPRNRQVAASPTKLLSVNGTCLSDMEFWDA